jgi:hypothetical protein
MVFLFTRSPEEGLIPETCRSRSDHPARYIHIKEITISKQIVVQADVGLSTLLKGRYRTEQIIHNEEEGF